MTNKQAIRNLVNRIKTTAKKLRVDPVELTLTDFLLENNDITPWHIRKYGHFNTIKNKFFNKNKELEDKELKIIYKVVGKNK